MIQSLGGKFCLITPHNNTVWRLPRPRAVVLPWEMLQHASKRLPIGSPRTFPPADGLKDLGEIILELSARMAGLTRDEMEGFVYQGMIDMACKRAAGDGYELTAETVNASAGSSKKMAPNAAINPTRIPTKRKLPRKLKSLRLLSA